MSYHDVHSKSHDYQEHGLEHAHIFLSFFLLQVSKIVFYKHLLENL